MLWTISLMLVMALAGKDAPEPTWTEILDAIWQVESGCRYDSPAGDKGKAIGPYQIHKDYWLDGTKFIGVSWPYQDAKDFKKARMVTYAYLKHYGMGKSKIEAAVCHNQGPLGFTNTKSAIIYRNKIIKALSPQPKDL